MRSTAIRDVRTAWYAPHGASWLDNHAPFTIDFGRREQTAAEPPNEGVALKA